MLEEGKGKEDRGETEERGRKRMLLGGAEKVMREGGREK